MSLPSCPLCCDGDVSQRKRRDATTGWLQHGTAEAGREGACMGEAPRRCRAGCWWTVETKSQPIGPIVAMNPCFESCKKSAGVPPGQERRFHVRGPLSPCCPPHLAQHFGRLVSGSACCTAMRTSSVATAVRVDRLAEDAVASRRCCSTRAASRLRGPRQRCGWSALHAVRRWQICISLDEEVVVVGRGRPQRWRGDEGRSMIV